MKLFGRNKELKEQIKIQDDLIAVANDTITSQSIAVGTLRKDLAKQSNETMAALRQRNEAQFDLRKANDELSKAKAEIAELKDANSGLASSVAELKQRLRTIEARNKELMKRLASSNRNIEKRKRDEQAEQVGKAQC